MKRIVICDANILIDYAKANKKIIGLVTEHLYEVWVPLPVWEEIEDLTNKEGKDLGLNIIEPSLAQTYEAANMYGGGLSDEDNICFIMARDEKAICATNEKPLRKRCLDNGIDVLWGLQMIIQLCEIGKLKVDGAVKIGEKIVKMNTRITQKVLDDFIAKLDAL